MDSKEIIITIIGLGNVGKNIASLLLAGDGFQGVINVLDVNPNVEGAILDLDHAAWARGKKALVLNSFSLFNESHFIFHAAGAQVPPGKSRLDVCEQSVALTEQIFEDFEPKQNPFIIVVANPVEIITHVTQKVTGLPPQYVVGTGTFLDTLRMSHLMSKDNPDMEKVNPILLGEHGQSVYWSPSLSTISGKPVSESIGSSLMNSYLDGVKNMAGKIKKTQGATIYGVSFCAYSIWEALQESKSIKLPLSVQVPLPLMRSLGCPEMYLSLMADVSSKGVFALADYSPEGEEFEGLCLAATTLLKSLPVRFT